LRGKEATPLLQHAVEALQLKVADLVLRGGRSASGVDAKGETGLHGIADMRHAPPGGAAKIADLLLDCGGAPKACDWDDLTPLHQAVRARYIAVVALLLARGAHPTPRHAIELFGR
jgi:ankyrin repeat protein